MSRPVCSSLLQGVHSLRPSTHSLFLIGKDLCWVQMSWALQGINNLSYDPLPPLSVAAPAPGDLPKQHSCSLCWGLPLFSVLLRFTVKMQDVRCGHSQ